MDDLIDRTLENLHIVHRLDHYMVGHSGFIAGGCFKNMFSKQQVKDIDIFFENESEWNMACEYYSNDEHYVFSYENDKVKAFKNKYSNVRVELIRYVFGNPSQIIANFDFTITKFSYYKHQELMDDGTNKIEYKVLHHKDFFEHLQIKRLVIDDKLVKPISSFERSYKYRDYGYHLCRESKMKLLVAIKQAEFTEIDLAKSLYDGMD